MFKLKAVLGGVVIALVTTSASAQSNMSTSGWREAAAAWRWEDATPLEREAYSCSAIFLVLASAVQNPEQEKLGQFAVAAQQILRPVAGMESKKRTGQNITNGFTGAVRDREARLLGVVYQNDKGRIIAKASECYAWVTIIAKDIQEGKLTDPSQVTLPANSPSIGFKAAEIEKWVTASFQAWKETGSMTPSEFKDFLKRDLAK